MLSIFALHLVKSAPKVQAEAPSAARLVVDPLVVRKCGKMMIGKTSKTTWQVWKILLEAMLVTRDVQVSC